MRKILFFLFFFSASMQAQTTVPSAEEVLKAAYKQASEQHKNVFVIFHASWCGWCKKMDASLNDSTCKKIFDDNYVTVHLTVHENDEHKKEENPGADEILKKLNASDTGIPFWLVYNNEGKLLATSFMQLANKKKENIGCPANEKEVAAFTAILKRTSSLTTKE
ncbi:MAG: thioredoxin family protein, partial [Bacteroidota bacterium]